MLNRCICFFSALFFIFSCQSDASDIKPFKANLIITSAGSWAVLSNNDRQSYFSKLSTTMYAHLFSVKTVIGVPIAWTTYVRPSGSDPDRDSVAMRVWPGDLDCYFGKRVGWIEPRIGLNVPLGYACDSRWNKLPWIGTNNLRLQTGFAISRGNFERIGLPFGLEAMISIALTERNAKYTRGSIGGELYIKSSINLTKKVTLGGELSLYGKSITWKWNGARERGFTLMPTVFGSYRTGKKIYIGCKAGFGPSLGYEPHRLFRRSYALDVGMSMQFYP